MIPIGDENPPGIRPYIMYILVALNVIVYLIDYVFTSTNFKGLQLNGLWNYSLVPYSLWTNNPTLIDYPVALSNGMRGVVQIPHTGLTPQYLTIFTSMFMHGGLLHIGFNMIFLWVFGNNIEDALGHVKFLIFYLACGVAAALAQVFTNMNSHVPMVGASGAIAGVLGAYIVLYPKNAIRTLITLPYFWTTVDISAFYFLGIWFVTQLTGILGSSPTGGGVAYMAHIGGFVAGVVLILVMGGLSGAKRTRSRRSYMSRYED